MEGVITHDKPRAVKQLNETVGHLAPTPAARRAMRKYRQSGNVLTRLIARRQQARTAAGLKRAAKLAEEFKEVQIDRKVTRTIKHEGSDIEIPLIFRAQLPLPETVSEMGFGSSKFLGTVGYNVTAHTPAPTPEALAAINEHAHKFDHLEVWWVPLNFQVEKKPDPDPILVGAIKAGENTYYYELHRWIDENVELGWWSREAY